ncbi:hypothetical protein DPMN_089365 [Dreissena polymorpha]|uniref:Uncharacterized protein n=1 Tax=Dreissena polymorpha TaxID=45954 RepID=A0A9D4KWQ5_DREPO|nr:hypothetical protein DPMN_089365 [Dreissena polymorpha]
MGQIVTLVRMVGPEDDTSHLDREGGSKVEVLGGNHTREALHTLHARGTLGRETVQVNLYRELPHTTALSIGFQHNAVLQEGRKLTNIPGQSAAHATLSSVGPYDEEAD